MCSHLGYGVKESARKTGVQKKETSRLLGVVKEGNRASSHQFPAHLWSTYWAQSNELERAEILRLSPLFQRAQGLGSREKRKCQTTQYQEAGGLRGGSCLGTR